MIVLGNVCLCLQGKTVLFYHKDGGTYISWNAIPCDYVCRYQCSGDTHNIHLQGQEYSPGKDPFILKMEAADSTKRLIPIDPTTQHHFLAHQFVAKTAKLSVNY